MGTNFEILGDLVERAARRLGELSEENRRLAAEVHSLSERIAANDAASVATRDWRRERSNVVSGLRQALSDLREGA